MSMSDWDYVDALLDNYKVPHRGALVSLGIMAEWLEEKAERDLENAIPCQELAARIRQLVENFGY